MRSAVIVLALVAACVGGCVKRVPKPPMIVDAAEVMATSEGEKT